MQQKFDLRCTSVIAFFCSTIPMLAPHDEHHRSSPAQWGQRVAASAIGSVQYGHGLMWADPIHIAVEVTDG